MDKDLKALDKRKKEFVISGNNLVGFIQGLIESFEFEDERDRQILEIELEGIFNSFSSACERAEDVLSRLEEALSEVDE